MTQGFTLAEVLITLGIIGVVAAMTLPTLIQHHRKSVVETRLAKFYSTINQAVNLSETVNGDKSTWSNSQAEFSGWETDENGNPDKTKPPKALAWYNKYLRDYLNTVKVDYEKNTTEGKVMAYFPDGSLMLFSTSSVIFYPEAKNYKVDEETGSRIKQDCGIKWFTFTTVNQNNKWSKGKGIEPYINNQWDGSTEMLLNHNTYGCNESPVQERAYCTKLIQMNGWKIPKDYPLKF